MSYRIGLVLASVCALGMIAVAGSAQSPSTPNSMYEEVKGWGPIPKPPPLSWEMGRVATDAKGAKVYVFRSRVPLEGIADETAGVATYLLAFEAAFAQLGDMQESAAE